MWKFIAAPFRIFGVIGTAADAAEYGLNNMVRNYRLSNEVTEKENVLKHQGALDRALLKASKEVVVEDSKLTQEIQMLSAEERQRFDVVKTKLDAFWKEYSSKNTVSE